MFVLALVAQPIEAILCTKSPVPDSLVVAARVDNSGHVVGCELNLQ